MTLSTAAAMNIAYGTDDQSIRKILPELKGVPQHVPLLFLNTDKGDYRRRHVTGTELTKIFGASALDPSSPTSNFAGIAWKNLPANTSCVIQRFRPSISYVDYSGPEPVTVTIPAPEAGIVVYAYHEFIASSDEEVVYAYMRDQITNEILVDDNGNYLLQDGEDGRPEKTVSGYVRTGIVYKKLPKVVDSTTAELRKSMLISDDKRSVIGVFIAEGHGTSYHNIGFKVQQSYEYGYTEQRTSVITVTAYDKTNGRPVVITTPTGANSLVYTLKEDAINPITNRNASFDNVITKGYGNIDDILLPLSPYIINTDSSVLEDGEGGQTRVGNLQSIIVNEGKILNELGYFQEGTNTNTLISTLEDWYSELDTTTTVDVNMESEQSEYSTLLRANFNLVNYMTLKNSKGISYEALRLSTQDKLEISLAGYTVITNDTSIPAYMDGSIDYVPSEDYNAQDYQKALVRELSRYSDTKDIVTSIPLNKETIFYDPGLDLEYKKTLGAFISNRRNTMLGFTTFEANKPYHELTIEEHVSIATSIKQVITLNLESDEYNTPTARAFIVMGDGEYVDNSYSGKVPLLSDYAYKLARMMGALNGEWSTIEGISGKDDSIIKTMKNISPNFIPDEVKDMLQVAGLIWPDNRDTRQFFYPAHQTIYTNDTSVMNTVPFMVAICTITTYNDQLWRLYSGMDDLSDDELKRDVEKDLGTLVKDKFAKKYIVSPNVYYTENDKAKGWIWRLAVSVYGYNAKTQQHSHIIALRRSDLS